MADQNKKNGSPYKSLTPSEWAKDAALGLVSPVTGTIQALSHPKEAYASIKSLMEGAASKAYRAYEQMPYAPPGIFGADTPIPMPNPYYNPKAVGRQRTPEEAKKEQALDAAFAPFGSRELAAQTWATHPGYFTGFVPMFADPAAAGPELLGVPSIVSKALKFSLDPGGQTAATALKLAGKGAKATAKTLAKMPTAAQSLKTGVPAPLLEEAYQVGKGAKNPPQTPGAETPSGAYERGASGQIPEREIKESIVNAINSFKQKGIAALRAGKAAVPGVVDPNELDNIWNQLYAEATRGAGAHGLTQAQKDAFANSKNMIDQFKQAGDFGVENADGLKGQFYNNAEASRNPVNKSSTAESKIYDSLRAGVDSQIKSVAPDYSDLMANAKAGIDSVRDLEDQVGGPKASSSALVVKTLKSLKGLGGNDLLETLRQENPNIPAMLSGTAAKTHVPFGGPAKIGALAFPALETALDATLLFPHDPAKAAMAAAVIPADFALSSPKIALGTRYAAGKVAGLVPDAFGDAAGAAGNMAGQGIKYATPVAAQAAKIAGPLYGSGQSVQKLEDFGPDVSPVSGPIPLTPEPEEPSQPSSAKEEVLPLPAPVQLGPEEPPEPHATGGRIERASGGRIEDHEHLVNRLMTMAKRAKKQTDETTKPLLNEPDNLVVKALDIAQRAI